MVAKTASIKLSLNVKTRRREVFPVRRLYRFWKRRRGGWAEAPQCVHCG